MQILYLMNSIERTYFLKLCDSINYIYNQFNNCEIFPLYNRKDHRFRTLMTTKYSLCIKERTIDFAL